MPILRRLALLPMLLIAAGCAIHVQTPRTERAAQDALMAQAQAFMQSYVTDLMEGRREAIVARYDPRGAYFVGQGRKELMLTPAITARYAEGGWHAPASFAWRDLSYEVVGPDAVVVTGMFEWGVSAERKIPVSYTGLLLRRDGRLVIRLEDESAAPQPAR